MIRLINRGLFSTILSAANYSFSSRMASALVILADGSEEMEFVISVDVLRRAGVKVTVGGLSGQGVVKCSRDVMILPDVALDSVDKNGFDCIVLPGGLGGAKAMAESSLVGDLLKNQEQSGKFIAAICAAPTALLSHSIGLGKSITSYPSVKDQLAAQYKYVDDQIVVQDGKLITSRGPGTSFKFALKIAENLVGEEKAKQVAAGMLVD